MKALYQNYKHHHHRLLQLLLKSRKRKDKIETVAEMLKKVGECQSATDQKLIELEEKRFKIEEKQMEREAQIRREREFQLRMIQMLVGGPSPYPNQPPVPYPASFGNSSTISPPPSHFYEEQDDEQY